MNLIEMKRYIDKLNNSEPNLALTKKIHSDFIESLVQKADPDILKGIIIYPSKRIHRQMNKTTLSLIAFLQKHPELRTWQAIRAWSGADFIFWNKMNKKTRKVDYFDTFYWEHKNK